MNSVALKRCKKEKSEIIKSHENKVKKLEIKILELVEFRNKKLSEEKELRLKQRKELRKSLKKKADNENSKEQYIISNITEEDDKELNINVPISNLFNTLNVENPETSQTETVGSNLVAPLAAAVPSPSTISCSASLLCKTPTTPSTLSISSSKVASHDFSSTMSTEDDVENNVTANTGGTFSETSTAEILAALKLMSNSMDKCIEEIRR